MRGEGSSASTLQLVKKNTAPAAIFLRAVECIAWLVLSILWTGPEISLLEVGNPLLSIVPSNVPRFSFCVRLNHDDIACHEFVHPRILDLYFAVSDSSQCRSIVLGMSWESSQLCATSLKCETNILRTFPQALRFGFIPQALREFFCIERHAYPYAATLFTAKSQPPSVLPPVPPAIFCCVYFHFTFENLRQRFSVIPVPG